MRSRRPPGSPGPGPGLARRPKQPQEPEAGAGEECDRGSAGARELASAGMGQQVGRVGEAPGLQQTQPRGSRGSSAARPSGRRRDPAGRTAAEAGFNIFTQHGECVPEAPARGAGRPRPGPGRSGRRTGSLRGAGRWKGAREEWGRNPLPSGPVTGGESHPSPSRLQPGWQLRGRRPGKWAPGPRGDRPLSVPGPGCATRSGRRARWVAPPGEGTRGEGRGGVGSILEVLVQIDHQRRERGVVSQRDWEIATESQETAACKVYL